MPPKKTKEHIAAAAAAGSKTKRKKWSKVKSKEKANHAVYYDNTAYDKLIRDIVKLKLITPSIVTDKLKVNVSLARQGIAELVSRNLIKLVGEHCHSQLIYTSNL